MKSTGHNKLLPQTLLLCGWTMLANFCSPLTAQTYAGAASCAPCHAAESRVQAHSHHAEALHAMPGSPLARALLTAGKSPDGSIHYTQAPEGVLAQIDGQPNVLLTWAFGAGAQGMTAVGTLAGTPDAPAFEHRFSAYTRSKGLAVTFGHSPHVSSPHAAFGVLQDDRTLRRCFTCHALLPHSEVPESRPVMPIEPGVQCEHCHGPGPQHIRAAQANLPPAEIRKTLLNPGRLSARAQVEICAACHRLPTQDSGDEPELADPVSVRFAPVGLMASRCFRQSKTLSCLSCHNPHEDARPATDLSYRDRCLTCHSSLRNIKLCRRAERANCISCHMQTASLGPHLTFTDHRIRVYTIRPLGNVAPIAH